MISLRLLHSCIAGGGVTSGFRDHAAQQRDEADEPSMASAENVRLRDTGRTIYRMCCIDRLRSQSIVPVQCWIIDCPLSGT